MAENSKRKHDEHSKLSAEVSSTDSSSVSDDNTPLNIAIELDELLDKLHGTRGDEPPSVSHWSLPDHDCVIRNYFKMRRSMVTPDDFLAHYLWNGEKGLYERFTKLSEIQAVQNFVEVSTACVNFTETELFLPSRISPEGNRAVTSKQILQFAKRLLASKPLRAENFSTDNLSALVMHLKTRLYDWLNTLADTVRKSPRDVSEISYEELFKDYLKVFNLRCVKEDHPKFGIPYNDGRRRVSSVPDLLFQRPEGLSRYSGVVEVKRMSADPSFKHAFDEAPKEGILSGSGEGLQPSKKRRVSFPPEAAPKSEEETKEKEIESGIVESQISESERQLIKLFFGRLFGHVLALDCCFPHGFDHPQQRLGIGVVGFRVIFVAFYSKPAVPFKNVPCEASNQMEVHITRHLSLLNASDRKEIANMLLALSANEPLYVEPE